MTTTCNCQKDYGTTVKEGCANCGSQPVGRSEIGAKVLELARQCCEGEVRTIPDTATAYIFGRELLRLATLEAQPRRPETIIINRTRHLAIAKGLDIPALAKHLHVSEEIADNWYNGKAQAPAKYECLLEAQPKAPASAVECAQAVWSTAPDRNYRDGQMNFEPGAKIIEAFTASAVAEAREMALEEAKAATSKVWGDSTSWYDQTKIEAAIDALKGKAAEGGV